MIKNNLFKPVWFPSLILNLEVKSKSDGAIIHAHSEKGHSWTRNGWIGFMCHIAGIEQNTTEETTIRNILSNRLVQRTGYVSYKTGVAARGLTITPNNHYGMASNETNSSEQGIHIGTSDDLFDIYDYRLRAGIPHGLTVGCIDRKSVV